MRKYDVLAGTELRKHILRMDVLDMNMWETKLSARQVTCLIYYFNKRYRGCWLHKFYNGKVFVARMF